MEALLLADELKTVLADALDLRDRAVAMDVSTPLLGAVPELDSIGVLNLIAALEAHFGIEISDDEITAANFESLGTLANFVERSLAALAA